MSPNQTEAVLAARRQQSQDKFRQVEKAIAQLRRERGRMTVRAIADRANVSSTFLYDNEAARALVQNTVTTSKRRLDLASEQTHNRIEATWRERALNAEAELTRAQKEVHAQRQQIGGLMGQIRDAEQMVSGESVQAVVTENTTLKRRILQLTRRNTAHSRNDLKVPGRTIASPTGASLTSKHNSSIPNRRDQLMQFRARSDRQPANDRSGQRSLVVD
ncbi:DUF6262 family protein [Streptomyces sp. NPDC055078]